MRSRKVAGDPIPAVIFPAGAGPGADPAACTEAARTWLAEQGYDPAFGARPMARLIERELRRPLAEAILFGPLAKGGRATVDLKDGRPCLSFG